LFVNGSFDASPNTSKQHLWRVKPAVAFADPNQAVLFAQCLKTSSGRGFAEKQL